MRDDREELMLSVLFIISLLVIGGLIGYAIHGNKSRAILSFTHVGLCCCKDRHPPLHKKTRISIDD